MAGIPSSKRALDLVVTIPGLILLSPILALLGLAVLITIGSPVLFKHIRPGMNGAPFTLLKFRTMTEDRDVDGELLDDARRLTPLGRLMRSLSLDELPTLFNVLWGEMSLVGPRPLLMQYLDRYSPEQARRHLVLPGMTGWAQVNGRNAITWEQKFTFDIWYVDNWSFWLDVRILALTAWKVLTREGISQPGHPTAEEFMGSPGNDTQLSDN
jgi:sugar transferase EpsL